MATEQERYEEAAPALRWPEQTALAGAISPDIDEMTVCIEPFDSYEQAMVAADIHVMVAREITALAPAAEEPHHRRLAFQNAVRARQCVHYAQYAAQTDHWEPTDREARIIAESGEMLARNQPVTEAGLPDRADFNEQVSAALSEALAHERTIDHITQLLADTPADNLLREEADQREIDGADAPHPGPAQRAIRSGHDDHIAGLVRMAAYLGDPPEGRREEIRRSGRYGEAIERLVSRANRVIVRHELTVRQVIGEQAAWHGADAWEMTDELTSADGLQVDDHECDDQCDRIPDRRHHQGHNIFIAYMHNGVRYIQTATEPFPEGMPRSRALLITEGVRQWLKYSMLDAREQGDPWDTRPYWRILHDLQGAVLAGVHDLDELTVEIVTTEAKSGDRQAGIRRRVIDGLALDNLHAARFLAGHALNAEVAGPTEEQARAVLEAAEAAGMDAHQRARLAESLYMDPAVAGIVRSPLSEADAEDAVSICGTLQAAYLYDRLTGP